MRSRVAGRIVDSAWPLSTRDTVDGCTPASDATSVIVARAFVAFIGLARLAGHTAALSPR